AYIILAILYCAFGYAMYLKNQVLIISEVQSGDMKESGIKIDTIYTFMGVAVSLFTLAIGIIFSQHEEIIAMVWLVESSLLYFAYKYTFSGKVFVGALILNVIGIIKLGILVDYNNTNDFMMLISLGIVFVSLLVNLKFLKLKDSVGRTVHDILHGLGMIILASLFVDIISGCNVIGGGILGISFFILILAFWYRHLRVVTTILKVFLLGSIAFIAISHIQTLSELFSLAIKEVKLVGGLLQPLTTIIIVTSLLVTKKIVSKKEEGILLASSALFLLITTTKYVYEIFSHNLFAITIYWGLLAFVIIGIGIEKNIIKCRTLGLYLLILTFGKIIFYDIWLGVDNTVTRVVALMLIGGLTIGISVLYTRKYGDNIKGELQVENLFKSKE
ncbi:MAG: hypothetical protein KAI16_03375, partial [Candidatus Pacebacteria bacterium]|nr:hypothetical protein [Candidatus Paceibacterota bacterium]